MILSTMRVSVKPVRFHDPVYEVPSRRVLLKPFQGQPRMFRNVIRMPSGAIQISSQMGAGMGYFVREDIRPGQPITLYAQNEIPEWLAEILAKEVPAQKIFRTCQSFILLICLNLCRATGTSVTITKPAAAWTPSQPQCEGTIFTVADIRLLDSPTQLLSSTHAS